MGNPPLKYRLLARLIGGDALKILTTIWEKASGYKTFAGLLITLLAFLSTWLPELLAAANASPELVAKVGGSLLTVIGLLHKLFKVLYPEESK